MFVLYPGQTQWNLEIKNAREIMKMENATEPNERNMHFVIPVIRKSKPAIARANTNSFRYSSENRQFLKPRTKGLNIGNSSTLSFVNDNFERNIFTYSRARL